MAARPLGCGRLGLRLGFWLWLSLGCTGVPALAGLFCGRLGAEGFDEAVHRVGLDKIRALATTPARKLGFDGPMDRPADGL